MGILLHKLAASQNEIARLDAVSIIGTDIDEDCLKRAEVATYPESALGETPLDLRERYFTRDAESYTVAREIRSRAAFRRSDLLHFESPVDEAHLILCRNVIIYFEREAQDALFAHFHRTLAAGGFLVLGKVETLLGDARGLFSPVNARERIFRKV
jgi:chemotaxis methyl-accepting protein methylase